jgi:3-oxoacyl-[acyl-carrier protein] reductase
MVDSAHLLFDAQTKSKNGGLMRRELIDTFSLAGKIAVVTGAASGIGRGISLVLAQAGASVVIGDIQEAALGQTAALVKATQAKVLTCVTDVSRRADIDRLATTATQQFGGVDVWVNCAGIMVKTSLLEVDEQMLDRGIAVNLKSVYWGSVAAGRAMKSRGGGSIINISSGGGESAVEGMSIYCITKAGVNMVTRCAAKEFGSFGVRANTIAPGWVDTEMVTHAFRDADGRIDPVKRTEIVRLRQQVSPLGITGEPRDIALVTLYLASDASRFMTGQILRPNGGVVMP